MRVREGVVALYLNSAVAVALRKGDFGDVARGIVAVLSEKLEGHVQDWNIYQQQCYAMRRALTTW